MVAALLVSVSAAVVSARPSSSGPIERPAVAAVGAIRVGDVVDMGPGRGGVRPITMAFTGDALFHSPLWEHARLNAGGAGFDFAPMLGRLAPILADVDLAICHLETPIAPVGEPFSTFPLYGVPAEVVTAIAASGHHRCSTASNHTLDRGVSGIERTIEVLEAHGLGQSGMARTPDEIEPAVFEVAGVLVSHLSYTYGYNGLRTPPGEPWRSALIEPDRIVADARRARQVGAELVIVSLHWGVEGMSAVTPLQRAQAEAITGSGAVDLIVGHHAHVLQPIELVNGVWVVYGLGNIVSNLRGGGRWPAAVSDGAVVVVGALIDERGGASVVAPVVHPTWVDRDAGWVVRPVLDELVDPATPPALRAQLAVSLARTRSVLGGHLAPPR